MNSLATGYVPVVLASRYSENYKLNFIYSFWVDILIHARWILNRDSGSLKRLGSRFSDSLFSHDSPPLNHILNRVPESRLNRLLWTPLLLIHYLCVPNCCTASSWCSLVLAQEQYSRRRQWIPLFTMFTIWCPIVHRVGTVVQKLTPSWPLTARRQLSGALYKGLPRNVHNDTVHNAYLQ